MATERLCYLLRPVSAFVRSGCIEPIEGQDTKPDPPTLLCEGALCFASGRDFTSTWRYHAADQYSVMMPIVNLQLTRSRCELRRQ